MIKKMRLLLSSVFAVVLCASLLPAVAFADDPSVNVSFEKTNNNNVEVYVENAGGASEAVSALQLTISVDVESGSLDGIEVDFAFSDSFSATIKESTPFNKDSRTLNIYVAGGNDLLSAKRDLGTLKFEANQSAEAKLKVTVAGSEGGAAEAQTESQTEAPMLFRSVNAANAVNALNSANAAPALRMVGSARNFIGGYTVQSSPAELIFQPQQSITKPEEVSNTPSVRKTNMSPIVPIPLNSAAKTPQTGDNLLPIIVGICVVAAIAAIVAFVMSRRAKKENSR